jgi:HSP20 family protein
MIPLSDDGHCSRGLGSDKSVDGRVMVFPSTSPKDLRVTVYDPLRGVPAAELKVRIKYATGKHYLY